AAWWGPRFPARSPGPPLPPGSAAPRRGALYELFIRQIDLPVGVTVVSLDDLKDKLVGVIIVALAVSFLAQIASWAGQTDLLSYGVSLALVMLALGAFNFLCCGKSGSDHDVQHYSGA